jgi:MFS family permease
MITANEKTARFGHAFRALRIENFRFYWLMGLFMTGAQGTTQLALAWLILDLTGKVGQLGLVIFIQGVAWTVVALVGGILADRYRRRNLLLGSQLFTAANLAILAVLTLGGLAETWQVYVSSLVLGTTNALTFPARQALIRNLVDADDMMNAVALNSMQMHSGRIVWPALAGVVIGTLGVGAALILGSACSVASIIFLALIKDLKENSSVGTTSAWRQVTAGLSYSFSTPLLKMVMMLNFGVAFFGLAYLNMAPGFAREELGFSAGKTGLFIMASGIGAIIAATTLVLHEIENRNTVVVLMCGCFGLSILALCLSPTDWSAFLFMALFGFSNSSFSIIAQTIFQVSVEPRYLGRVIGLWSMGGGIGALTALPIGLAGDHFGLRWSLGFVSAVLVAVTLLVFVMFLPHVRRMAAPRVATVPY